MTTAATQVPRTRVRPQPPMAAETDRLPGWGTLPSAALACGVMAGLLELLVFLVQTRLLRRVDAFSLHVNRHVHWMIPTAEALVVTTAALVLVAPVLIAARWRGRSPRWARSWMGLSLGSLLVVGPMLAVRGLAWWGACLLALGVGFRARRFLGSISDRAAPRMGLLAGIGLVVFAVAQWRLVTSAPDRAWTLPAPAAETPNLLFIVLDTVRANRLSLHGYERPTSPELERWAARGVTFLGARAPATWTLPSHISMFTGLRPGDHGARVDRAFAGPWPTLAEFLGARGHATAGFVSNFGMCNASYGVGRGFDTYVDLPCNNEVRPALVLNSSALGRVASTALDKLGLTIDLKDLYPHHRSAREINAWASAWLAAHEAREHRPFFLFLNYMDAHSPYLPRTDMPRWCSGDRPALSRREAMPATAWRALEAARRDPAKMVEYEAVRQLLGDLYDDCLRGLDAELGRFLDELEAQGTLDNTWVVITSDHGEYLGERGLFGHGIGVHDPGIHVPLVIIPPRRHDADENAHPRGIRVSEFVSPCDLPRTLGSRLCPGAASPFPGRDLARFWGEGETVDDEVVVCEMHTQAMGGNDVKSDLVRTNSARFLDGHVLIEPMNGPGELYDLKADPRQERNLFSDPTQARRVARMRGAR